MKISASFLLALVFTLPSAAQVGKSQSVLDANVATREELAKLPGLDAARIDALVAARPFLDAKALDAQLAGSLATEQRKALYAHLFVAINLDTATREEILLIPRMGPRMAHEFEEYRPYGSLARFRKEIGKYVDAGEVARLEQYVFVPIKLNSATDEDILSIPGLGKRMLHEFKEYRPYTSIEQFRKEIGKYVDAKEVARLERYVVVD
ncbi:MAG: hypothetical protein SF066_02520 [Thermoanaerobaculia bacterium]|nr:hypothetical protein [Thermoanaerobaculia bacterium]